ncbi:hypothetical protein AV650_15315 [Serratia fonticola]|nr:hypothetical protein AV650_15315 [Serratia fonticola]
MSIEIYDLENVYDEQISPLMQQIIAICREHNMPMIASFAFENCKDRGIGCCTTVLNDFGNRNVKEFDEATQVIQRRPVVMAMTVMNGRRD